MALKIFYQSVTGEFAKAMEDAYRPIAEAGTSAIHRAGYMIKTQGRADIAAAGFSKRWQNALRVDVYPNGRRVSINAAAVIYHKIPYADVFETGATIRGKPKLWIPLTSTPKKVAGRRMTAKRFTDEVGPLFTMKIRGKPFLAANMSITKAQANAKSYGKVTTTRLRKGSGLSDSRTNLTRAVPLFVGVDSVKIRDKFSIREITDNAASKLAAFYVESLNVG